MLLRIIFIFLVIFCAPVHAQEGRQAERKEEKYQIGISVLASSSLSDVMPQIARLYAQKYGKAISFTFETPRNLVDMVERGEPADVLIMEDPQGLLNLKQQGVLDFSSLTTLFTNRIALVASKEHYLVRNDMLDGNVDLAALLKELGEKSLITFANPDESYIGAQIRMALENMGTWEYTAPFIIRSASARHSVRSILKSKGLGFVYLSDASYNKHLHIISLVPKRFHDKIEYKAAVVAGENMNQARLFMRFILSDEVQKYFKEYGFTLEQ